MLTLFSYSGAGGASTARRCSSLGAIAAATKGRCVTADESTSEGSEYWDGNDDELVSLASCPQDDIDATILPQAMQQAWAAEAPSSPRPSASSITAQEAQQEPIQGRQQLLQPTASAATPRQSGAAAFAAARRATAAPASVGVAAFASAASQERRRNSAPAVVEYTERVEDIAVAVAEAIERCRAEHSGESGAEALDSEEDEESEQDSDCGVPVFGVKLRRGCRAQRF